MSLFTGKGDQGTTKLFDSKSGERISKASAVSEALGTLDELNSWLGRVAAQLRPAAGDGQSLPHFRHLLYIQDNLFRLGAELASSPQVRLPATFLTKLERTTKRLQRQLEPNWASKFLLPGGSSVAADVDIARAVCRRLERELAIYSQDQPVRPAVSRTVNRLSDYLFVLRVALNVEQEVEEQLFNRQI